jgi:hypothetical protein
MQNGKAREPADWGPFAKTSHNLHWWSALNLERYIHPTGFGAIELLSCASCMAERGRSPVILDVGHGTA